MNRKKCYILIFVLMLIIGFAAVSTTLVINGTLNINGNADDFDVYFSAATITDGGTVSGIGSKTLTFSTHTLKNINEISTLDYTVYNNSTEYDADVTISCVASTESDYFTVTSTFDGESVTDVANTTAITMAAQEKKDGKIVIKQTKTYAEEDDLSVEYKCIIIATPTSRTEIVAREETKTAVETIMELADGADESSIEAIGSTGLAYDGTTDNNLRYIGSDPNNYVTFNGETWRIIGVMNNVDDGTGTTESRVKLIRSELLGSYSWDSSASSINSGYGINEWSQADLMTELNGDYLNTALTANTNWYNGLGNAQTGEFDYTKVLTIESQSMIDNAKWNLGAASWNSTNGKLLSAYYTEERGTTTYIVGSNSGYNDTVTRTTSWTGKVALMYPSDYGYATSGGSTTSRSTCLATSLQYLSSRGWSDSSVSDCNNNDWLFNSSYQWTLTPYSGGANHSFYVGGSGYVHANSTNSPFGVRPVLYLKSSVKITSGDGTQENPYQLSL